MIGFSTRRSFDDTTDSKEIRKSTEYCTSQKLLLSKNFEEISWESWEVFFEVTF